MSNTMELHGARTGNCLRAAIALEEAGLAYTVYRLDLRSGEHRQTAHLSINQAGKVPTLIDRRGPRPIIVSQSNAIVFHASDQAPGSLMPLEDSSARAMTYERFFFFVTDVVAPSFDGYYLRSRNSVDGAQLLEKRVLDGLAWAERYVAETAYMAGEAFSMADIAAYTIAYSVEDELDWKALPNLQRWYRDVGRRPGIQRGMHAFDEFNR